MEKDVASGNYNFLYTRSIVQKRNTFKKYYIVEELVNEALLKECQTHSKRYHDCETGKYFWRSPKHKMYVSLMIPPPTHTLFFDGPSLPTFNDSLMADAYVRLLTGDFQWGLVSGWSGSCNGVQDE